MIDWIKAKMEIPSDRVPANVRDQVLASFDWQNIQFMPKINGSYEATKQSTKHAGLGDMRLVIHGQHYPNLIISNSIHKLFAKGANHTDFTYSAIEWTIDHISEVLDMDFKKAELTGKFEFSVNLEVPDPEAYYQSQSSYKTAYDADMRKGNKVYGKSHELGAYKVKTYSPSKKSKIQRDRQTPPNDLVRFEIALNKVSQLRQWNIPINTVGDLLDKQNLAKLGQKLIETNKKIAHKTAMPVLKNMQEHGNYLFFEQADPQAHKRARADQRSTYYKNKRLYQQQKNSSFIEPWIREVPEMIRKKWHDLMSG